jgi:hypothetical protein
MTKDIKQKVTAIVEEYKKLFRSEYNDFLEAQTDKKENLNTKWAETKGTDYLIRHLIEVPETLFVLIKRRLSDEDYQWYETLEAKEWFGATFPEFLMSEKV